MIIIGLTADYFYFYHVSEAHPTTENKSNLTRLKITHVEKVLILSVSEMCGVNKPLQNAQDFGSFLSSRGELSKEQGKERGEEQDQGKEQVARSKGRREKMEQGAMWKEGARE
jgi:hypothetical protein